MHRPLSDALAWGLMIDPETVVTKAGELMTCLRMIPPDKSSWSPAHLMVSRAAMNTAILGFESRWALWVHCACDWTTEYESPASMPDPVSARCDEERRRLFVRTGKQLSRKNVISLLYAPPGDALGKLTAGFDDPGRKDDDRRHDREMARFRETVEAFRLQLANFMPYVGALRDDALATYLHNRVSTDHRPLVAPPIPTFLSEYLTDDTYISGVYPMLGDHHIRTVVVKDQPANFSPGMLDEMHDINFPFDHVARWLPLDSDASEAVLASRRDSWNAAVKTFFTKIMASAFKRADDGTKDNQDAIQRREGAAAALALLATRQCTFGHWSHSVTVSDPDLEVVNERCRRIRNVFRGFPSLVAEDTAMSVWMGSIPGHPRAGLARFLGPSISFAEIMPSSAIWTGPERDEHLDGPPLLRCIGEGGTPFNLCLHQEGSDIGHVVVTGESGGGKSSLLKSILVGHRKYRGAREFYIDRGEVAKLPVLAMGGSVHSLAGGDESMSLQPLVRIHDPLELVWANGFVLGCLRQQGVDATPHQRGELTGALHALASRPAKERTLTHLRHAVQDHDLKEALATFCVGGECGELLDNDEHRVGGDADVKLFEVDALLDNQTALAPVMAVIFHEIARSYADDRPTLVVIDEAKQFISNPLTAAPLDEMIRRGRRERLHIVLATHSMLDIEESLLSAIIASSFKGKIFTADASALEPNTAACLARHGLSPRQISQVASLTPKKEYIMAAGGNWRKFELSLSDYEKAVVCGGSGAESKIIDEIMNAGPREEFHERWIAHKLGRRPLLAAAE